MARKRIPVGKRRKPQAAAPVKPARPKRSAAAPRTPHQPDSGAADLTALRALVDSVPNSIFSLDRNYCYTTFNRTHVTVMQMNYGAHIQIGGCFLDYCTVAADRVNARQNFDRALCGERFIYESYSIDPKLGPDTVQIIFNPICDAAGVVSGLSVFTRNISWQLQAENRLLASEARFRALIENAADMIAVVDETGTYRYASPNSERTLGYRPADMLGSRVFDYVHPDDLRRVEQLFAEGLATPKPVRYAELRFRHRDGFWLWLEVAGRNLLADPAVQGVVVNARDITARVHVEEALRESEARFFTALKNVPIVVSHVDRDLRYTWVHNALQRHGQRSEAVIGKRDDEFLPPHLAETWMAIKRRVLTTGCPERMEHEFDLGGDHVVYDTTIEPKRSDSGEIEGLTVVSFDVTRLKRAEEEVRRLNAELECRVAERTAELQESEARYRILFNAQTMAVIVFDGETRQIVDVNDAAVALYGYTRAELLSLSPGALTAEPKATAAAFERHLAGDRTPVPLRRHRRKDGTIIELEIWPNAFTLKGRPVVGVMIRDISELQAMERRLRESEAKFRSLAEQSPNMIFINQGGRIVYANPKCLELLGYTRDELLAPGFHYLMTIAPDSVDRVRAKYESHLRGEDFGDYEYGLLAKTGRCIDAILSTSWIDYENGKAILGIVTDITDRKKIERQQSHQRERLRRLAAKLASAQDDEQRRIADGLHDDVAQVLAACRFQLASLRPGTAEAEAAAVHTDVAELLGQAQEKLRTLSFELASSSLNRLGLEAALEELCARTTRRHGLRVDFRGHSTPMLLTEAVATVLFKSTRELLFNVVKHAHAEWAAVIIAHDPQTLRISVEDNGGGFKVGATGPEEGLGLFGIRERLRDLGGELQIQSVPGANTCVTLVLPLTAC